MLSWEQEAELQLAGANGVPVGATLLVILGDELDHVVDAQNGDGRLRGKLQRLHLGHGRLEHTGLPVVTHDAGHQVQAEPAYAHKRQAIHHGHECTIDELKDSLLMMN